MTRLPDSRAASDRAPSVLLIAGLDPSGGAGLLADASVVARFGPLHAAGVATALTVQDSAGCACATPVEAALVGDQLARLLDDLRIVAVKIGLIGSAAVARAVASALAKLAGQAPIVIDPVLRASRGVRLLEDDATAALAGLFPLATLVTPNLDELAQLAGVPRPETPDAMAAAAERLRALGARAVLAKGGHLPGDPIDVLVDEQGLLRLPGARIAGEAPHGTGCALSTEIACRLALGAPLREAIRAACAHVKERIAQARAIGRSRLFLG